MWVVEYYDGYRADVDVGVVGVIGLRFRVVDIWGKFDFFGI